MTSMQRWSSTVLWLYTNRLQTFTEMTKNGNIPEEVIAGVLVPLPNPGKPQGPPANLRPIILLSILRKILAICMIKRIQEKIENRIPLSQAAYRAQRSTTEHVFTCKILAEKAITSECYETTILLLDMSKAFDTVKGNNLMKLLETILDPDETHMKIFLKDVKLSVRIGKKFDEKITTNIGVPHGGCLSPILFTLYIGDTLKTERSKITEEHNYSKIPMNSEDLLQKHLKDHTLQITKGKLITNRSIVSK